MIAAIAASSARADPPARRARDEALGAAAEIRARVRTFPNLRGRHALGVWSERDDVVFHVRPRAECLAALDRLGVPHEIARPRRLGLPIPTPVIVSGPVGGVLFRKHHDGARREVPLVMACEMATRLPALARLLARHGVREVRVLSAWRREPYTSFHTMGLGLDLHTFGRDAGDWVVERDFVARPGVRTCDALPAEATSAGEHLRALACELGASGLFSTVLTPEYDEGHANHFHVDARPDDRRVFVR